MHRVALPSTRCPTRPRRVVATPSRTEFRPSLDQAIAQSYSVATLDVDEYVSGKTFMTLPGRLVQGLLPAPLRFTVW